VPRHFAEIGPVPHRDRFEETGGQEMRSVGGF